MKDMLPIQPPLPQTTAITDVPQVRGTSNMAPQSTQPSGGPPKNWLQDEEAKFDVEGLTEAGLWPEYQRAIRAILQSKYTKDRNLNLGASAWDPELLRSYADTARKVTYADGSKPAWVDEIDSILEWNQQRRNQTDLFRQYAEWNNQPGNRQGEPGYRSYSQWVAGRQPQIVQDQAPSTTQPLPQPSAPPPRPASPTSIAGAYRRGLLNRV